MELLRFSGRLLQTAMLGIMSLIFLGVGIFTGFFLSRDAQNEAERVAKLTPMTRMALERAAVGTPVLLEAQVSSRNPTKFRSFVAYVREEYRGRDSDGDADWREDERVTPPLLLDLDGGVVQIGNGDYRISRSHEKWQESNTLFWNGLSGEGTKRYAGLVAGGKLLVIGTIQRGREGNTVQAEQVFGGTQAEYIENQRSTARFLPFFGLIFGVIGLIMLGAAVRKLLVG
ncbi:hypothetical protein OSCT_2714 [Oscillochloris trichoides DG-6]|uniref:Uncharacterized protein n=1 Tax=Oscillochloris trichoides DG-6 TaxID=765420 RepID=E1IHB3_9CHLR|nr:hypothetical protein [Oscillochloris trichoides]EFO79588.1 hypothetical protein OSCT_2714 [Oscillochloris trichoides DG-6]